MIDSVWSQISGAVAGGVVGGISGFVANLLQQRQDLWRCRRSVACALAGEIEALVQFVEHGSRLNLAVQYNAGTGTFLHHHLRVERDYMTVFRGLGSNIGVLPSPLPRDVVTWYTRLAICLERTRELHDLALNRHPELSAYAGEIVERQHTELTELVGAAQPLLERLASVGARRGHAWIGPFSTPSA